MSNSLILNATHAVQNVLQKSLADLVRGIRAHKKDESQYIASALQEIREELRSPNMSLKSIAVQKLTYLHMLGYDINWAAFNIVEVMSATKFTIKRLGYLAASQTFNDSTEVAILATGLIRKDIMGSSPYDAGVALNCLSNICTADLARDLAADVVSALTTSRPYVKKKAILALYKIFLRFPEALRPAFPRLKEKLEDSEMGAVASAVNVICELARKNPKNYLSLAPTLFKLLTTATSNWMLIKIVKLFGALAPLEKRLAKKLVDPLSTLISSTSAMSLLYECIQTCISGLAEYPNVIRLCLSKLRQFVEDSDQNLKYLGLVALAKIMKIQPKAVNEHKDLIIWCLDDEDITIRTRALELLTGMVSKKNLVDIITKLTDHLQKAEGPYKDELVEKIILICSQSNYVFVTDFEWYVSVLVLLSHVTGTKHGGLICQQLMDVIIRVKVIRPYGVQQMSALLQDKTLVSDSVGKDTLYEVLYGAAWVTGEFLEYAEGLLEVVEALLQARAAVLPAHIQAVYIHNLLKVLSLKTVSTEDESAIAHEASQLPELIKVAKEKLPLFTSSIHLEVQERACFALALIELLEGNLANGNEILSELQSLFADPLNPVAPGAAKRVPVPEGLDLETTLNEIPEEEEEPEEEWSADPKGIWGAPEAKNTPQLTSEDIEKAREQRNRRNQGDVMYLKDVPENNSYQRLTSEDLGLSGPAASAPTVVRKPKKGKGKHENVAIIGDMEEPEGAAVVKPGKKKKKGAVSETPVLQGKDKALADIDLNKPLQADESLPVRKHHQVAPTKPAKPTKKELEEKSTKTKKGTKEEKTGKKKGSKTEKTTKASTKKGKKKADAAPASLLDLGPLSGPSSTSAPDYSDAYQTLTSPPVAKANPKLETAPSAKKAAKGTKKEAENEKPTKKSKKASEEDSAPNPNLRLLAEDDRVKLLYGVKGSTAQPKKAAVELIIEAKKKVTNVEPKSIQALGVEPKGPVDVIAVGATARFLLLFETESITSAQQVPATLTYNSLKGAGTLNFNIKLLCSAFVEPMEIPKDQWEKILMDSSALASASTSLTVPDAKSACLALTVLLHVGVLQGSTPTTLAMYGKSQLGHHVVVYVKKISKTSLKVDLKASDASLANSLIQEVNDFFKKS